MNLIGSQQCIIAGVDTDTQTLIVDEPGGFSGAVQPDVWTLDQATQTLNVSHRTPAGTALTASFALGTNPPSGALAINSEPRRVNYRFPRQIGEPLTGTDAQTGASATLALDPANREVIIDEGQGPQSFVIAPSDWTSIGFGPFRFTVFRIDTPEFGLFGLVLERNEQAEGFITLRDGITRQANYDLTGQAAQTAELIYLHTDHLQTPRLATNDTQTVLWRWQGEAFGNTAPQEDPDGDGTATTFNLRFPGQYHDTETDLYYNWFRYYDPGKGRYITSDPVGLDGGLNTYVYASQNPIRRIDPLGTVDWEGTITGGGLFVAGFMFDLKTKCVNGKRGFATVILTGPGLGVSAMDFSLTSADLEIRDPLSFVDPFVFNDASLDGGFIASAAFAWPPTPEIELGRRLAGVKGNPAHGHGCAAIRLGVAGGVGCGPVWGLDVSLGFTVGSSTVVSSRVEDCCESE